KSSLVESIALLVKSKKIEGVTDLRDESDRDGMRIVLELKRDAVEDVVLNQLYHHTQMETTFGVINLALLEGQPRVLPLKDSMQASRERVLDILKAEFLEVKDQFGDDRRTAVELQAYDMQIEDLIPEEDNVVTITNTGYIKRLPVSVYRKQRRGGKGVTGMDTKEEDYVVDLFVASTHDFILFFSSKGKVFKRKAFKLPAAGRYARGKPVVNLLERLDPDEKVEAMIPTREFP